MYRKQLQVESLRSLHILLGFHQMTNIHARELLSRNGLAYCRPSSQNQKCRGSGAEQHFRL